MPATQTEDAWAPAWSMDRGRLLRLCARLSGDWQAAEDLVQETLYQAWLLRGRPRERDREAQWLAAVARRVCLRWRRSQGREARRMQRAAAEPADRPDIEAELERSELVDLLDRALARLPEGTRRVLVERFVRESPHAEIAGRMGLTEGAVAMRVQRGKRQLRRILTTQYREEAAAYGLADLTAPDWEQTRIWCPNCGTRRLWGRWLPGRRLWLECWGCGGRPRIILTHGWVGEHLWGRTCAEVLAGVSGFKPAANRLLAATHEVYRQGIGGQVGRCLRCGRACPLRMAPWDDVQVVCRRCGVADGVSAMGGVAFCHPAMQAFWRRHGRVRSRPERRVEAAGVPAVVFRIESLTDSSAVDVILARDSLVPLGAHGAPPG